MDILLHRAPSEVVRRAITSGLNASGQGLRRADRAPFALSVGEPVVAGCLGEIALTALRIDALWVDPGMRRRGLAKRLLAAAEDHARREGARRIHLQTRNPAARKMLEGAGFSVFGELPGYDGARSLVYMEKPLLPKAA
ncbi:MAG: GNAT family N-acetyltransferase [Shimia sp.]